MSYRRVSLREVAKKASVSIGTASDILNGKGLYNEETRKQVRQIAADLHYVPNALIRSLQSGTTMTIGVYTWLPDADITHQIALFLMQGISRGISEVGRDVLFYSPWHTRNEAHSISLFLDKRIDGLIWAPGDTPQSMLEALAATSLPTVALYHRTAPDTMGMVDVDNAGGVSLAVDYLVGLGHRRIGFDGMLRSPDFGERAEGYQCSLERHGLPLDPELMIAPPSGWMELDAAVDRLLGQSDPPTALFVSTDNRAFRWLEALQARGIRVPQDISLIGFDDVPAAGMGSGLTTIRQPCEDVGYRAVLFVERLIQGGNAAECRAVLPVELKVRGSSAPPAKTDRRRVRTK